MSDNQMTPAVTRQHIAEAVTAISRIIQDMEALSPNSGLCMRGRKALAFLTARAEHSLGREQTP